MEEIKGSKKRKGKLKLINRRAKEAIVGRKIDLIVNEWYSEQKGTSDSGAQSRAVAGVNFTWRN